MKLMLRGNYEAIECNVCIKITDLIFFDMYNI